MARLIEGGRDSYRTSMYGAMSESTFEFLQNKISTITERYGSGAKWFQEKVQSVFNKGAVRSLSLARNNLEYSGGVFKGGIRRLRTVEEFRKANLKNQHHLLAHPYFQREMESGRIEGWGYMTSGFDKLKGTNNPYYQAAVDGMVQFGDEHFGEDTGEDVIVIYDSDELEPIELKINEKIMVRDNWTRLYNLINGSDEEEVVDPTSLHGSYL